MTLDWRERNRREVWARRSEMWAPKAAPVGTVAIVDDLIQQAEVWDEPVFVRYNQAIWRELEYRREQWDYFQCVLGLGIGTFRMGYSCQRPIEINLTA